VDDGAVDLLAAVPVAAGVEVKVTPTAAQSARAAAVAVSISGPVQVERMQLVVPATKAGLLQRQALSVGIQLPKSAFAKHAIAQAGRLPWATEEAMEAAKARTARKARIMKERLR